MQHATIVMISIIISKVKYLYVMCVAYIDNLHYELGMSKSVKIKPGFPKPSGIIKIKIKPGFLDRNPDFQPEDRVPYFNVELN